MILEQEGNTAAERREQVYAVLTRRCKVLSYFF